jgi:hypothetical protein
MANGKTVVVRLREEVLPPHDPSHGTPHAMRRRIAEFELPDGASVWEQSDYGHPGRFNPWEQRRIDAKLQGKTAALRAAAEAVEALLA